MADKHFLVNGAMCKCLYGTKTDKLVVTQTKEYINDKDGSEKTIANTKDTKTPFMGKAVAFGNCAKKNNNPCALNLTEWKGFYQNITLSNGGKLLTEDSTGICAFVNEECISVVHHGQTAQVTRAHFDKADITTLAVLNPLSPPVTTDKTKEVPRVKSIEVVFDNRKEKPKFTTTEKNNNKPLKVLARPNEPMTFQVAAYHNHSKDNVDTSKVCWKIFNEHDFKNAEGAFDEIGPELKLDYDVPGKYRILAYGNPNASEKSKNDETCCIDLEVRVNGLKPELRIDNCLVNKKLKGTKPYYYTKVEQTLEVSAQYEIEPPTDDERRRVRMEVVDSAGNRLETTLLGEDRIKFTASGRGAVYTVKAILCPVSVWSWITMGVKPDRPPGYELMFDIEQQSIQEIETEVNSVVKVLSDPPGQLVRPCTQMSFAVTKMDYDIEVMEESIHSFAIRWALNGDLLPDRGKALILNGDRLKDEGNYLIDAFVEGEHKESHQAECRFTVTKNYVRQIIANTRWVVGRQDNAVALLTMDHDPVDGAIHWKVDDEEKPGTGETLLETFSTPGKHGIVAQINDRPCRLEISAEYAKIERWCFMDSRKMYKPKAGWCEALTAVIRSRDAVGETVNLHLLENKNGIHSYVKDLGPITFDKDGTAAITLDTSALQPLLQNTSSTGSSYEVCVVMAKKNGGIQFDGLETIDVDGQPYLFPGASKKSTVTNHETGQYVSLSGEPEVVTVHYLDAQGNRIYKVLKYGEKVKIYVQTRNLAGQKVTCTLYQNNVAEQDAVARAAEEFNVDDDESLSIDIDTNKLKEVVEEGKRKFLAMFYALLEDPEKDKFWYPEEIAQTQEFDTCKVNFYQHLKLSEEVGEINKEAATNSFVVLGEALEVEEKVCKCEARVRAFMRMIRVGEGTTGDIGYETLYSFKSFIKDYNKDWSTHPQIISDDGASSAAGAYQIMGFTFKELNGVEFKPGTHTPTGKYLEHKDYIKKYGIPDFSPESQDKLCMVILKHKRAGILPLIFANKIEKAIETYGSWEWASLPPQRYPPQKTKSMPKCLLNYLKFLNEEKNEITDLHLKKGFLKEFGYDCCAGQDNSYIENDASQNWHNPLDIMELRGWYTKGWRPDLSQYGENDDRIEGKHDGLDLYAPVGSTVYACVDGIIHDSYVSETYGEVIIIEGDYDDLRTYFFYAHLSYRDFGDTDIGRKVNHGDVLGKTGQTGNAKKLSAKQAHLHFEVKHVGSESGNAIDPYLIDAIRNNVNQNPLQENQG